MGCDSSYLEPNRIEVERVRAAKLLCDYFRLQEMIVPLDVLSAAESPYGGPGDVHIVELCKRLSELNDFERDVLLYTDARDKSRRALAEWWEEHEAADKDRFARDAKVVSDELLRREGLAKLTAEERKALGL